MALSDVQRAGFEADGYLLVPGLLSEQAAALRADGHSVIRRLQDRQPIDGTWDSAAAVTENLQEIELLHCHDLQFHSALFGRMLSDPLLVDPVADLLGTPNVSLHHNKFFVKPPSNGAPFPLHQDWPFFPHANDSPLAAIVHLDESSEEKGCVRVMPGSHRLGRLEHEGDRHWYLPTSQYPLEGSLAVPARAGDVLFFSCLMVHGSGVNQSDEARSTWLIQFRDPDDTPTVDRHRSPGQGTMLRGHNAGANEPPPTTL